jgi:predicted dehydrogenase
LSIADSDIFKLEIDHFIDCIINNTECICKNEEAVQLMEIIDAIYKSAETGKTIYF